MGSRPYIDITGQRFGKLVAIEPAYSDGQGMRWRLKCDCGNFHDARGNVLRLGNVKSCGCAKAPVKGLKRGPMQCLIGKRFGISTVVNRIGDIGDNRKRHWECVCDCGVRFHARGSDLTAGNTKSCGCLKHHQWSVE
jgi:hypothetical protein